MLLWSGLCISGLTATTPPLMGDKVAFTDIDLSQWRMLIGLISVLLPVLGLILETVHMHAFEVPPIRAANEPTPMTGWLGAGAGHLDSTFVQYKRIQQTLG